MYVQLSVITKYNLELFKNFSYDSFISEQSLEAPKLSSLSSISRKGHPASPFSRPLVSSHEELVLFVG